MATIGYLRYSTDKQDEQSQLNIIKPYLAAKGMALDKVYKDEGVSGGVSYKSRNLFHLCEDAQKGDIVVISEVSRLTRAGFGEIYEIINTYFKPNNMRLIVCNVGLDIDCTSLEGNPMMELQLSMLATFAKIERQLIKERTRAGLAAKREQRTAAGLPASWATEYGKNTGTTHAQSLTKAREARARNQRLKANENPNNEKFWSQVQIFERAHSMCVLDDIEAFTQDLITAKVKTASGLDMTPARARSMYHNMKLRYS